MKRILHIAPVLLILLAPLQAFGIVNTLPVVTTTTLTSDTGVFTGGKASASIMVWNAAGTATVLLEEQSTDSAGAAPWVLVKTMVNCSSTGVDGSSVPCSYSTITPKQRTRLRVSACSGCSVHRIIEVVGP